MVQRSNEFIRVLMNAIPAETKFVDLTFLNLIDLRPIENEISNHAPCVCRSCVCLCVQVRLQYTVELRVLVASACRRCTADFASSRRSLKEVHRWTVEKRRCVDCVVEGAVKQRDAHQHFTQLGRAVHGGRMSLSLLCCPSYTSPPDAIV